MYFYQFSELKDKLLSKIQLTKESYALTELLLLYYHNGIAGIILTNEQFQIIQKQTLSNNLYSPSYPHRYFACTQSI